MRQDTRPTGHRAIDAEALGVKQTPPGRLLDDGLTDAERRERALRMRRQEAPHVCRLLQVVERYCNVVDAVVGVRAGYLDGTGDDPQNPMVRDPSIPGSALTQRLANLCLAGNRAAAELELALRENERGWKSGNDGLDNP